MKTTEPCFVIFRTDDYASGPCITVKLVVWSVEEANAQVERLMGLNRKGCRYHWELSRALRRTLPEKNLG